MDKEGGWISFYYFPGRVINSVGITSGGASVCVCVRVCASVGMNQGEGESLKK